MKVYKGFNSQLQCTRGSGTYQYEIGRNEVTDEANIGKNGFHSSENPVETLRWYPLGSGGKICLCEAGGSIEEEQEDRISSTELKPLEVLNTVQLAVHIMAYICDHPFRECEFHDETTDIGKETADAKIIAIAVGENPRARAKVGGIAGVIQKKDGKIIGVNFKRIRENSDEKWLFVKETANG